MAGYTRQSTASIINGSSITAPPINAEFNQLLAAFNASSGHGHTGGTGDAPKIPLTTSVSGYLPLAHGGVGGRNNVTNSVPGAGDDSADGYAPGSIWENSSTGRVYICVGNNSGAAVWRELVQVDSGNAILPASNDSVDLGNNSTRFQDLFLSGGIAAAGNVAIGGTLTTVGTSAFTGLATFANLSATGTTTITSVDLNSGAIDNAVIGSATPAAGTFTALNANTSLVAATADINGGTIDGAALGATTPSTGSFTTLGASGTSTLATVDINGGNIDGTVIGASTKAAGSFTTLSTTGQATLASADINGGSIDGSTIGANSASTGAFTTLTASGGITGSLTGNVTGNTAGVHTGAVTGNVTGNLTGNVTAGSGTSTFTNLVVNGNLNMNAGTSATITNLTAPSSDLDAATKKYVDDEISTLVGDAGAGLDTLGELADALNDDDAFSTTVTNSIATKLPKAGGTMTGAIAMSTNKITGAGNPTSAQDVATKAYTDTQRDTRVAKTGDTMSGALAMGNNKITGLATPTATTDATTKTYVDGILGSATVAATSATNAATSETNAASSATAASNSASAASTSATNAASSYDQFDDRYLGAKSSAPTVDNDGDALITGALYFNSTTNIMNVYGSGGWQSAGSAVNGTSERNTYTATAGQTVFAATYDSGYVDAFLNGVKLLAGTDFTATNGTSITLASGASVNDVVDIVAYGTFVLADHYTKIASDARYVEVAGDSMTGDLSFGDNNKAIFGSSNDLNIRHDPTNGSIFENINSASTVSFRSNGPVIQFWDSQNGGYYIHAARDGAISLAYARQTKFVTTSTGIDVTGTVTSDGLTVDGDLFFNSSVTTPTVKANRSLEFDIDNDGNQSAAAYKFFADNKTKQVLQVGETGDISFYDDSNNAKFFWDASAESLGLGTVSPQAPLDFGVTSTNQQVLLLRQNGNSRTGLSVSNDYGVRVLAPHDIASTGSLFGVGKNNGTTYSGDLLTVQYGGNVGIGLADPSDKLTVSAGAGDGIFLEDDSNSGSSPFIKARGKRSDANNSQSFGGKLLLEGHRTDAAVASGKNLGTVSFGGNHTNGTDTNILYSASISGVSEGTFSNATTMPTGLAFYTGSTGRADNTANVTSGSEAMRITSTGAVGIGATAPDGNSNLQIQNDSGNALLRLRSSTTGLSGVDFGDSGDIDIGGIRYNNSSNYMYFNTNTSEAMRIDSGGVVHVGGTSESGTGQVSLNPSGYIKARKNNVTGIFDRISTDGDIVQLRKDGSTVGSIVSRAGVVSSIVLDPRSGGSSLTAGQVGGTQPFIASGNNSGSSEADATVNLGKSTARFKDLYLSGGVYLGGTGAANKLDDYESGTWTPTYLGSTSNPTITYDSETSASYIKVGKIVFIQGSIKTDAVSGGSGNLYLGGLPFTSASAVSPKRKGGISVSGYQTSFTGTVKPTGGYINTTVNIVTLMSNMSTASAITVQTTALNNTTNDNFMMFHGQYVID